MLINSNSMLTRRKSLDNVEEIRRSNLKEFINQKFLSLSDFARQYGSNKSNISTLLNGSRGFTDFTANKIEVTFALPQGYLSSEEHNAFTLIDLINAKFYEDVKYLAESSREKNIKLPVEIVHNLKLNNGTDLLVTYMNDDLMNPTIKPNEMIFIDYSQKKVEYGMLYLIEINNFFYVRRLFNKGDSISIHIDNLVEKVNYIVNTISLTDINVIGKFVGSIKSS